MLKIKIKNFTMIELFVVLAIIGILVTILLPALVNARAKAKLFVCMNNQNQILTAGYVYASKNNSYLVADHITNDDNNLFFAARYLPFISGFEDNDAIFNYETAAATFDQVSPYQCPSFIKDEVKLDYTTNSMNLAKNDGFGNLPLEDNTSRAHKIPQIPVASETGYLVEVNQYRADARANNYDNWDVWNEDKTTFRKNGDPNGRANRKTRMMHMSDQTHFGVMNVTFIDGHIETRRLNQSGVPFTLFLPNF